MDRIKHYEFPTKLRKVIEQTQGSLKVALRVDGDPQDTNIVINKWGSRQEWFVGHNGGFGRSDTWNLVSWICTALTIPDFDTPIQKVYEDAINVRKTGWVVLTIKDGVPVRATHCQII